MIGLMLAMLILWGEATKHLYFMLASHHLGILLFLLPQGALCGSLSHFQGSSKDLSTSFWIYFSATSLEIMSTLSPSWISRLHQGSNLICIYPTSSFDMCKGLYQGHQGLTQHKSSPQNAKVPQARALLSPQAISMGFSRSSFTWTRAPSGVSWSPSSNR